MAELPKLYPLPFSIEGLASPEGIIPEQALSDPTGEGRRAWEIASKLKITEGPLAGRAFGEVAAPWQRLAIIAIWGHRDERRRRIFRRVVTSCARKNGKTAFAAILALLEMLMSDEARGQILSLAAVRDQAALVFKNVAAMIRINPWLSRQFNVVDFQHKITHVRTGTEFKSIASEQTSTIGFGPSFSVIDEVHLIGLTHQKGLDLVHTMESGSLARPEPLTVFISTVPVSESAGIYEEVYSNARRILAGEIDDRRTLCLLFEIPESLDHEDPQHWWRSNPSLGTTVRLEDLRERFEHAKRSGPAAIAEFKSQNLNVLPINREAAVSVWIAPADWRAAEEPSLAWERVLQECPDVSIGVDAGGASDFTCAVIIGTADDGRHLAAAKFFISRMGYEAQRNAAPLDAAIAAGELVVVDRVGDDVQRVVAEIIEIHKQGKVRAIGVDPYALAEPAKRIQDITGTEPIAVPQGYRISPHLDSCERAILSGQLVHAPNALFDWSMGNAHVVHSREARSLSKPDQIRDSARKIDAAIALVCAWCVHESVPGTQWVTGRLVMI